MNRLQSELNRLYLPRTPAHAEADAQASPLIGPDDTVRAMVLELARPPSWALLSNVWRGVQTDLELPSPAIAVSGTDGLQLWFSLAEPVAAGRAQAFLERLRQRFLPEIDPSRVRLMLQAPQVPAAQGQTGNWSAFVAPDLAPVFEDAPWLDIAPNDEGQASLLSVIEVAKPAAFEAAMRKLAAVEQAPVATRLDERHPPSEAAAVSCDADARRFLLQVMHDETVALALRIEAAKALLQHPQGG